MTDMEKAKIILSSFPGRNDCYGAGRGACVKEPLTKPVILRHILGKERIGRYLLCQDGRIGVLAVDIDINNLYIAIEFSERCLHYSLVAPIERSKAKGYHIWLFFKGLLLARKARLVASYILDECDLLGKVELFPKRDFLRPNGWGSYINLPMFGQDMRRGRTVFLDPKTNYKPYRAQWSFLASRPHISEKQLDEIIELNDLDEQPPSEVVKEEDGAATGCEGMGLPCFRRMLQEGVDHGVRNEAALRLSVELYRTGIPKDLGLTILKEWNNKRNRPPMDDAELEGAVSNGYSGLYGHGCLSTLIQRYCDPSCPIYRKYSQDDGNRKRR